ncbi:MAG: hypothetical protein ACR2PH_00095 [Desulfobulbia bacterium]
MIIGDKIFFSAIVMEDAKNPERIAGIGIEFEESLSFKEGDEIRITFSEDGTFILRLYEDDIPPTLN